MTREEVNYYNAGRSAGIDECLEVVKQMCDEGDGRAFVLEGNWLNARVLERRMVALKEAER